MAFFGRKVHGAMCAVCDNAVYGPDGGVFPDTMVTDDIWVNLQQECEDFGWFTVTRGGVSALVCSTRCAERWLHPDEDSQWGGYGDTSYTPKAPAVRAAVESIESETFSSRDVLDIAREAVPGVSHSHVSSVLNSLVRKGVLLRKNVDGKVSYSRPVVSE